jgi:hypothetical protein
MVNEYWDADGFEAWLEEFGEDLLFEYKEELALGIDEDDLPKMIWLDTLTIENIDEDWLSKRYEKYLIAMEEDKGLIG